MSAGACSTQLVRPYQAFEVLKTPFDTKHGGRRDRGGATVTALTLVAMLGAPMIDDVRFSAVSDLCLHSDDVCLSSFVLHPKQE